MTETSKAWGIITGDGNDTVVNSGSIVTEIVLNGADPLAGVGILAGAGNDTVVLDDGSSVTGDVDLGADDDTLYLIGSPVVSGDVFPDGAGVPDIGTDSLVFEGAGFFANSLQGFNRATKHGLGVYTVEDGLPPMQRLEVKEGTLQLGTLENKKDYQFSETGTFLTQVNTDGSHGKLHVTGTAQLGGGLTVFRGPEGAYVNGTKYDIIEATGAQNSLTGGFSDVLLPMPTTLLSFDVNQLPNLVEVEVLAKSFTTVATNRVELAIARYLDRIIGTATGDLSKVIGEFQMLSMPEFDAAFASLSPGPYDNATRTTYDVTQQYTNTLLKRMHSVQLTGTSASTVPQIIALSGKETKFLAYDGSDASIWQLYKSGQQKEATYGVWLDGFGQSGDQEEGDGFTGYDYNLYGVSLGFDQIFCNKYIAGIGIGYSDTDIDLDRNEGDSDIESIYGSLYGSYYTGRGYIDAVLSYGSQDYGNERPIVIGSIERTARSDHDGDAYSAFVEGGYNIALNQWVFQPFASLHYIYLDEDGFRETGADSLNQIVDDRQTESLVSELGLRVAHVFELNRGALIPEMSLAWNYDFDIDDRTITTSFAGAPDTAFSIEGQDVTEHGVTVGAGVTLMNKGRFSTSLKYNGEFREDYQAHGVIGELRYEF